MLPLANALGTNPSVPARSAFSTLFFCHIALIRLLGQCGHDRRHGLVLASAKGHLFIVKRLLDHGAKTNIKENGKYTALDHAIQNDHRDIAKLLTDHRVTSKKQ